MPSRLLEGILFPLLTNLCRQHLSEATLVEMLTVFICNHKINIDHTPRKKNVERKHKKGFNAS